MVEIGKILGEIGDKSRKKKNGERGFWAPPFIQNAMLCNKKHTLPHCFFCNFVGWVKNLNYLNKVSREYHTLLYCIVFKENKTMTPVNRENSHVLLFDADVNDALTSWKMRLKPAATSIAKPKLEYEINNWEKKYLDEYVQNTK